MAKVKNTAGKISFGRKKQGKAVKSHNKHNSNSAYHKRNASR
jgi:hypothetical protein